MVLAWDWLGLREDSHAKSGGAWRGFPGLTLTLILALRHWVHHLEFWPHTFFINTSPFVAVCHLCDVSHLHRRKYCADGRRQSRVRAVAAVETARTALRRDRRGDRIGTYQILL